MSMPLPISPGTESPSPVRVSEEAQFMPAAMVQAPSTPDPAALPGLSHLQERFGETISRVLAGGRISDIHFVGDANAWVVRAGVLEQTDVFVKNAELQIWADLLAAGRGGAHELLRGEAGALNAGAEVTLPDMGKTRLRVIFRRQLNGTGVTIRLIPASPPRLADDIFARNPIPAIVIETALRANAGIMLFCGPTGSGKTMMMSALLAEVNHTQPKHIYTIEDPIEFVHRPVESLITQREVGDHTDSFASALKASMRSKPDIILVGELLDLQTVRVAIEAANKGHLVMTTTHASSAEEALSSLVGQFPGNEQEQVALLLSQALRTVVVQRLVPLNAQSAGVVPVREVLVSNTAIAANVRTQEFRQITGNLKLTSGMFTLEDDLATLVAMGQITEETARSVALRDKEMSHRLDFIAQNPEQRAKFASRWTADAWQRVGAG